MYQIKVSVSFWHYIRALFRGRRFTLFNTGWGRGRLWITKKTHQAEWES